MTTCLPCPCPSAEIDPTQEEYARIKKDNVYLAAEVKRLSVLVEKLTFQLAVLRRMQFGRKAEALSDVMDDMFGTPTELETPTTPPPPPPRKTSREPKAPPRITLPPNLPVEVITLDLPEADKLNADGSPLRRIGEEVSDRLAIEPGRFYIKRTVRPKYADPALPENGVRCTPMPARIIDGGLLDESMLADRA